MVCLNNIIIYLNSEQKHEEYIKWVLKKLYKKDIPIISKKCEFYTKKINFIGFIIKLKQINVYTRRVVALSEPSPLKPHQKLENSHLNISTTT